MKKIIVLSLCMLSGCAALRGQLKYTGAGDRPTIKERIVRYPEMPKPSMQFGENEKRNKKDEPKDVMGNYWTLPVDKVATALNPLDKAVNIHVECNASFPSSFDVVVPAHMSQDMLLTTNVQYMYETLCQITKYSVIEDKNESR